MTEGFFIGQMAEAAGDVEREMKAAIREITAFCEEYRHLGKRFTFDATGIGDDIDTMLIALSDAIMDDFYDRIDRTLEDAGTDEDRDDIYLFIGRETDGMTAQDRVDRHVSRLKWSLEGLLAVCFTEGIFRGNMEMRIWLALTSPEASALLRKAREGGGYAASFIRDGNLNSRRGYAGNIAKAISAIGDELIAEAFHYGMILHYGHEGAVGYRVKRNSTFNCPLCDSLCATVHPLTEIVLPAHPRCCCSTYPVFPGEY